MNYATITPDGEFARHTGDIDWRAAVGPEGQVRVSLHSALAVAAWVNDCGLRFPDRYPRNITGSCVLAALGASHQPYAGTIVFTGWDATNMLRGLSEIVPLLPARADAVETLTADVRRALAGDPPRDLSPSWGEQIREIAEHVRSAPTPTLKIRGLRLP